MSFVPAEIKMDRCPLTHRFVWKQRPVHPRMELAVEEDKFLLTTYVYNRGENDLLADVYWRKFNREVQGGSNMTGTDLCVNKPHCAAAVRP